MCVVCRRRDGEDRVLGCWGWREGDIGCGGLEKETEFVVWELWRRRSGVKGGRSKKGK